MRDVAMTYLTDFLASYYFIIIIFLIFYFSSSFLS